MMIIAFAGVFAHAGSTLGAFDAFARLLLCFAGGETTMLAMIMLLALLAVATIPDLTTWRPRRLGYR